jgi:hypothetical protein
VRFQVAVAAAAVALAIPAASEAKVVTYGGRISPGGKIALDVKVGKKKVPKKVVAIRADQVPATCETSGAQVLVWTKVRRLGAEVRDEAFKVNLVDAEFGNRSKITGEFRGGSRKLAGDFAYSSHFPAGDGLPEEDCGTEKLEYTARRGGEDVVVPPAGAAGRRG